MKKNLKPEWALLPFDTLEGVPAVMAYGNAKHGANVWRSVLVNHLVYVSKVLRHLFAWIGGEDYDEDSGLHHLDHALADLMILRHGARQVGGHVRRNSDQQP